MTIQWLGSSSLAHSRRFSASAFVNTPAMRVPQLVQQPFFSRFDITECHERVITTCLHPGQIVFAAVGEDVALVNVLQPHPHGHAGARGAASPAASAACPAA